MADVFYKVIIDPHGARYDASGSVVSIGVTLNEAGSDALALTLEDAYKVLAYAVQEGQDVEVTLGHTGDARTVFKGQIYGVKSDMPPDGLPSLTVTAYDALFK